MLGAARPMPGKEFVKFGYDVIVDARVPEGVVPPRYWRYAE
jgi:hypothetical protein